MKFLNSKWDNHNLMPIHIVSYDTFELGLRDAIAITFKDMDTGKTYVETIDHPKYEVYVLKKQYWDSATIIDIYAELDKLDRYVVSYHYRDRDLSKILGCSPDDVIHSPLIFGYDISIEHYYWIQFLLEYGNDHPKKISVGYFDIESDIIQIDGFAAPGEAPTSAVTFIKQDTNEVFTIALMKDNLPVLSETNPHFDEIARMKEHFYEQVDYLKTHLSDFIKECHENFDEFYGEMKYEVILVEDEIQLHLIFWDLVRNSNLDYLMAWNAPYDIRNLIERPLTLGYEPESIICDPDFKYKTTFFEEDDNVQVHKRNHRCCISVKPLLLCQMWMYAGVRSGKGKQPSMKLNAIAKKELKDEKLNYEEEGNIRTFMYKNLWKFLMYNIKDVLLQLGIGRTTKDIDTVYDRCYENAMLIPEAFVSTTMLTQSLTKYFLQQGYIMGTNANRTEPPFDWRQYVPDADSGISEEQILEDAANYDPDDYPDSEFDFDGVSGGMNEEGEDLY